MIQQHTVRRFSNYYNSDLWLFINTLLQHAIIVNFELHNVVNLHNGKCNLKNVLTCKTFFKGCNITVIVLYYNGVDVNLICVSVSVDLNKCIDLICVSVSVYLNKCIDCIKNVSSPAPEPVCIAWPSPRIWQPILQHRQQSGPPWRNPSQRKPLHHGHPTHHMCPQ